MAGDKVILPNSQLSEHTQRLRVHKSVPWLLAWDLEKLAWIRRF